MRIIVCGGRDCEDEEYVYDVMNYIHEQYPITHLFHGNARGVDSLADSWGHDLDSKIFIHPVSAQWKKHGKKAGPIRNQIMLGNNIDFVVAFPGGRGTQDMVNRVRKSGLPVCIASGLYRHESYAEPILTWDREPIKRLI